MRSHLTIGAACTAAVITATVTGTSSQAAGGAGTWAQWSNLNDSPKSMTIAAQGFGAPTATYTTDSASISTNSDFLNAQTPPGQRFGTSQGTSPLRLGLKDPANDEPSTTVYTFTEPTPTGHFAFALGDLDVDKVQIAATTTGGAPVTAEQIGFQSTFNFCNGQAPYPSSCGGQTWTALPEWIPGEMTLQAIPPGDDTDGASGWFMPTVPLTSLTLTFSPLPLGANTSYRTWFVGDDVPAEPSPPPTSSTPTQSTSPSPSPTQSTVTPTPTPSPTRSPAERSRIPLKVRTSATKIPRTGTTTVVRSIKTDGRVLARTVCRPRQATSAGEARLCTKHFDRAKGRITIRTFGRDTAIKVVITSIPTGADRARYRMHRQTFHFRTA